MQINDRVTFLYFYCFAGWQPRILMAMARDGLLPQWFSALSRTTGVPLNATIVTGLFAALLAFTMSLEQLSAMVS